MCYHDPKNVVAIDNDSETLDSCKWLLNYVIQKVYES